jgi:formate hydrogenlyase subunit 3/multisubunit Na+/H+ antiporter MnhD subunit
MPPLAATGWGFLPMLAVVLPVLAMVVALPLGARGAERMTIALLLPGFLLALGTAIAVQSSGAPAIHLLGHWSPPLGLAFRADGLAAAMLLTAAIVIAAVALFARDGFGIRTGAPETRTAFAFWPLLLALWGGINLAVVANDLFTLYVALELLTFAAMPLVCLEGKRETIEAALRYLMFALLGSVLYLLGVALIYGSAGTLDITLLSGRLGLDAPVIVAAALMTAGLLAKTALLPLHLWLPPAHAGAPAAASAVLSALVVKGSFVILVRLWFGVLATTPSLPAMQILAGLGAAAILLGSAAALAQPRLKLLVAYSTVAQIGYLFLMFPLVAGMPDSEAAAKAWTGGSVQAISHAFAKAAMFLAVGLMAARLGHDRIADLAGAAWRIPVPLLTFGLAGLTLMGVPPSGGFAAKWLLLSAAIEAGQWWWALVVLGGGLLTGGYVYRVLSVSLTSSGTLAPPAPHPPGAPDAIALGLAVLSVALGFLPLASFGLVQVGRMGLAP